jgi:hypothetical protein
MTVLAAKLTAINVFWHNIMIEAGTIPVHSLKIILSNAKLGKGLISPPRSQPVV